MAEVFGAVASGIGIAGVAAQAIDGIRKLQIFCNDVRDAPEEIKYLTNELEILLSTIAGIEAQIQRNASICQNLNPTPALRFVNQSVISLDAVVQKLNGEIAQKRTLTSMKTAWKKKVLEAHIAKIERSKTSLGLAVSAYSTELFLQTAVKTDTRMDQLSMNVATLTTSCQSRLMPTPKFHISAGRQIDRSQQALIDDYRWDIGYRAKSSRAIPILSFSLILPRWLAHYSLQISVRRAAQSWTLNLKPYRTVPRDFELWDAIAEGDFNRLRHLINSGQATVFDRDEDGLTPLHALATHVSLDDSTTFSRMARFCVERGADVNEPDCEGVPAIYHLNTQNLTYVHAKLYDFWNMELFRLLVDGIDLDPELFWEHYGSLVARPSPAFEKALERVFPLVTIECPKFTIAERLRFVAGIGLNLISPRDLANYLDVGSLEAAYPVLEDHLKRELLRVAMTQWGYWSGWSTSEEWEYTLRALLIAETNDEVSRSQDTVMHPTVSGPAKPEHRGVVGLIRNFVRPYVWAKTNIRGGRIVARDSLKGFRYLISRTEYLGIKLETTRSCERHDICFDEEFMRSSCDMFGWGTCIDPHTLSLYYDDDSSTWVMWNAMYEQYCGEFWNLLEFQTGERTMPGTWVD